VPPALAAARRGGAQHVPRPPVWSPGPPPPWPDDHRPGLDALLAGADVVGGELRPDFDGARPSAVLVALAESGDGRGPSILLTKRSMVLRNHRGEISFPGGRIDPGETPTQTALREAHEEVGLDPSLVTFHGELGHLNTVVSRSYIVPLVATVPEPVDLAPASIEVERVLWVPVAELTRAGVYRSERWGSPPTDRTIHFFDLDDETIWGATAHLLVQLLQRA
jgi:8-oxo-dGTP pyrophosphatase MutT (NUDIX family)